MDLFNSATQYVASFFGGGHPLDDTPRLPTSSSQSSKKQHVEMDVWGVLEEMASKSRWYDKVFDDEIVAKWRAEVGNDDLFDLALGLLRATAQGVKHLPDCTWDDSATVCSECLERLKVEILKDPEAHGFGGRVIDANFFNNRYWTFDLSEDDRCGHPRCNCTAPDSSLHNYVEYMPLGVLSSGTHAKLKALISEIAAKEPVDWHPGSDEQVRDIIHPSLFPYVKGVSVKADKSVDPPCDESEQFQWLPADMAVGPEGKCTFTSYINNLKADLYPEFVPMAEQVFDAFLPALEKVLHQPLRGRGLQIIVKVGSILLTPEKPNYNGGSWHIEGMPYEHIAATCLHYVDVQNITESFLEFRKPVIIFDEGDLDYPQSDGDYTTHHYGIEPGSHHDGFMNRYLGLIRCHEGASVVFPNTLQHHVKDFSLAKGASSAIRTILAFFVIDPNHRIVSTTDVPPQQELIPLEQAHHFRERLMYHRKFFVNSMNNDVFERPFSLCEH